jgi:hypothetical protein
MGGKLAVAAPPLLVTGVIGFVYGTFMLETVLPQWQRASGRATAADPMAYTPSMSTLWVEMGVFHFLFAMLVLTFIRSMTVAPGSIPRTEYWRHGTFNIPAWKEEKLNVIISDTAITGDKLAAVRVRHAGRRAWRARAGRGSALDVHACAVRRRRPS